MPTPIVQMRLPAELVRRLDAVAKASGRSRTAVVVVACQEYLDRDAEAA